VKAIDEMMLYTEDSDIVDVEIENSLPDLSSKRKFSRKAKARARKLAHKRIGSPEAPKSTDLYNSKAPNVSSNNNFSSPNKSERNSRKSSQELPPTGTSGETDIIQATSRSACRRKRVISSDEESSQENKAPKKVSKLNKSTPTKPLHAAPFSNTIFDATESSEKLDRPFTKEPQTPKSQKRGLSQLKWSNNQRVVENESKIVQAINESPPLTESQVSYMSYWT